MPLFELSANKSPVKLRKKVFQSEKKLQSLVESHLEDFFKIKFVGTEVTTGEKHGGRIDTLGIDENGSPVIIEYKKEEARDIINQGLFYLDWLLDHKGDFQVLVQENLNDDLEIQWDRPRVILIANNFKKYDRHAVQRIGENIELKEYTLYENDLVEFEDVYVPESLHQTSRDSAESYSLENHFEKASAETKQLFEEVREFIVEKEDVTEVPLKLYIAYKTATNFCCVELQKKQLKFWLSLKLENIDDPHGIARDVSDSGHWGTGDIEVKVKPGDNLDPVKDLIEISYRENS